MCKMLAGSSEGSATLEAGDSFKWVFSLTKWTWLEQFKATAITKSGIGEI